MSGRRPTCPCSQRWHLGRNQGADVSIGTVQEQLAAQRLREQSDRMVDDIVEALRVRFGQDWAENTDANIRFAIEAERLVADVDDVHMIGEPELDEHHITLQFWVDRPISDLMTADQVAFDIFARISVEIFYSERQFVEGAIVYAFVTGSSRHGHSGSVVLAGPHAAEFSERFRQRLVGGPRYHA